MAASAMPKPAAARKKRKTVKIGKRRISYRSIGILTGIGIFSLLLWAALQPIKGTEKFGICRVFIERSLTYPLELAISSVLEGGNMVRMEYTTTNEYGEYILSTVDCIFRPDPKTTWALADVQINKAKVPQEKLAIFNSTIPFILQNLPDLTLPDAPTADLTTLKR